MLHKIGNTFTKNLNLAGDFLLKNYRLENAELLKCPKNSVSEHIWTVNMLKGPKHCLNINGSIFVIFFDHSEKKSAPNILF